MGFSIDANGWGVPTPTTGWQDGYRTGAPSVSTTMIIFVSKVSGSDATSSTEGSKATPYKTIAKALTRTGGIGSVRNGSPDWILLATGETWPDESPPQWWGAGLNEQNRMVFSSYDKTANISAPNNPPVANPYTGPVARPILKTPLGNYHNMAYVYANTAIMGIDFYAYTRDTTINPANASNPNPGTGILMINDFSNVYIEDNCIRWFENGITVDSQGTAGLCGPVSLRRNVIYNCWGDKYGIGSWRVNPGFLIEENLIDHCGWDTVGDPNGSTLNHNLYISGNNTLNPAVGDGIAVSDLYFHGNINTNSLMQENNRTGGHFNNNLWQIAGHGGTNYGPNNPAIPNLVENEVAIGGFLGGSSHADMPSSWLEMANTPGPDTNGGFWGHGVPGIQHINVNNCITTQGFSNADGSIVIGGAFGGNLVTVTGCISYKFSANGAVVNSFGDSYIDGGGNLGTNSPTQAAANGWPHPERTPPTYMAEVIHDGSTWADFVRRCKQQSKRNWNRLLMAESVNDYIRVGFGKQPIGSAYAGGGTIATGTVTVRDAAGTTASVPVTLNISS